MGLGGATLASITKRNGGFTVRWREDGRARRAQVETHAEARALRAEIEGRGGDAHSRAGAGASGPPARAPRDLGRGAAVAAPCTWNDAITAWLREEAVRCRASTLQARAQACSTLARWAAERGVHGPLDVNHGLMVTYWTWLTTSPGKHGPPRKRISCIQMVRSVELFLRWLSAAAAEFGWRTPSPIRPLRLPKVDIAATTAPTLAQADAMLDELAKPAATGHAASVAAWRLATIQRFTGARIGEVMVARWRDIDLHRARWTIPLTKTGRPRWVPLASPLLQAMRDWRQLADDEVADDEALVLGAALTQPVMSRRLSMAWAEAGVPRELWHYRTSHSLRKAVRTHLASVDVAADTLDVLLGHGRGVIERYEDLTRRWPGLVRAVDQLVLDDDQARSAG